MSEAATIQPVARKRTAALTLAALGVVFGDIGTSPLYTVKECFSEFTGLQPDADNVLGILSLITWALIIIVTLKYVVVVMRADNRGEGGVLALMALVSRSAAITPAPPQHLPDARHGGRRAVLRRLPADAGDLGAERGRGPQGRDARARSRWSCRSRSASWWRCSPSSTSARPASAAGSGRSRCSGSSCCSCWACARSSRRRRCCRRSSPHHAFVLRCTTASSPSWPWAR